MLEKQLPIKATFRLRRGEYKVFFELKINTLPLLGFKN